MSERAGPKLSATLEPGNNQVLLERRRNFFGEVCGALEYDPGVPQPVLQFAIIPPPAQRCARHGLGRVAELARDGEGRPESGPGVAGRRLYPHPLKRSLPPEPRI